MKLVQINTTCGSGSTGKICVAVSELLTERGIKNYIFYASGQSDYPLGCRYMQPWEVKLQALKSRTFGNYGFNSCSATKKLISMLEDIQPDIVHLHNLHGHNCNLEILFTYLRQKKVRLFWTFHDCWVFTGYCPHYDMVGCQQWKTGCESCPQRKHYSWFFDRSRYLFEKKKELLEGLELTIVTPSKWLAQQVRQSFLHKCEVKVIHNGIDLSIFKPRESYFREKHACRNKFIILGVAFDWGVRKGLDIFVELAKRLDERYQIILVGTNDMVDKQLTDNIISIHRTQNQTELAEIYSAADVFVNPTREEVLGLTNIEALACGTPIITFDTGGSPECCDETCGAVAAKEDVNAMEREIRRICEDRPFSTEACMRRAKDFDANKKFQEYMDLYMPWAEK